MNKQILLLLCCFSLCIATTTSAVDKSAYNELIVVNDSAKILETPVFAPKTWEKAIKAFDKARKRNPAKQKAKKH